MGIFFFVDLGNRDVRVESGKLGGGDVSGSARGDMANLSVAVGATATGRTRMVPWTHFSAGGSDVRAVGHRRGDFYVANGSSSECRRLVQSGESVGAKVLDGDGLMRRFCGGATWSVDQWIINPTVI